MFYRFTILFTSFLFILFSSCSQPQIFLSEGTYYIDSGSGSDENDGLSPDTAWKSLDKLSYTVVAPGSKILFYSGQVFRGNIIPSSGTVSKPVEYGIFGGTEKAVIQNSIELSSETDWNYKSSGIWKAADAFSVDIGNIIFNGNSCAVRKWSRSELTKDLDYYYDSFWNILYLKSDINPGTRFSSIEAAITEHIIDQTDTSYASFSDLHLRYGGAHGFGGGSTEGLNIRDCEFSYIGGGYLYTRDGEEVRYGNGIEFWGNASDNLVEDCYFHDIYDTGVTNQNHTSSAVQTNITYRNNIIENCALACFEFWSRPGTSQMRNITFEQNTCINPGSGWGEQRPDIHGSHVSVFGNEAALNGITIRNNIFFGGNMIYFFDKNTFASPTVSADSNCLYPIEDGSYDYLCIVWDDISLETSRKYSAGSIAELRSDSGRETSSISTEPEFVQMQYPYSIETGSACEGIGAVSN